MAEILDHEGQEHVAGSLDAQASSRPSVADTSTEMPVGSCHTDLIRRTKQLRKVHDPAHAGADGDGGGHDVRGTDVFDVPCGLAPLGLVVDG